VETKHVKKDSKEAESFEVHGADQETKEKKGESK